jgi:hypothetical protein
VSDASELKVSSGRFGKMPTSEHFWDLPVVTVFVTTERHFLKLWGNPNSAKRIGIKEFAFLVVSRNVPN